MHKLPDAPADGSRASDAPRSRRLPTVAQRLAWRDVGAHKRRSALVVSLIACVVAGVLAGVTLAACMTPTADEYVTRALGAADGRLTIEAFEGEFCDRDPGSVAGGCIVGQFAVQDAPGAPSAAAPAGFRVARVAVGGTVLDRAVAGGRVLPTPVPVLAGDLSDPVFAGRWDLVAGQVATGADVVVSRPLLARFGVGVGGQIATDKGSFRIAGVLAAPELKDPVVFVAPGHPLAAGAVETEALLVGDRVLSAAEVGALNRRGVAYVSAALARQVDPGWGALLQYAPLVVLVGALAAVLVAFVAGSAFAIGVRTSRRQLGLLGAVGAERRLVAAVVTWNALWLTGIAVVIGLAAGIPLGLLLAGRIAAADVGMPVWGPHVPWPGIAAAGALGLGSGLAAAVAPAVAARRVDAMGALRAAEAPSGRARVPVVGLVALCLAAASLVGGAILYRPDVDGRDFERRLVGVLLWAAGAVLGLAGIALGLGALLSLLARAVPRRPLTLRLVVRDLARKRASVVPALSAVVAAATLGGTVLAGLAGASAFERTGRHWSVQPTHVLLTGDATEEGRPAAKGVPAVVDVLGPPARVVTLHTAAASFVRPEVNRCPGQNSERAAKLDDWRCHHLATGGYPELVVGDAAELEFLLGRAATDAERADLGRGALLTTDRQAVADGRVTLTELQDASGGAPAREVSLPARYLKQSVEPRGWALLSTQAADKLTLKPGYDRVVLVYATRPTDAQLDQVEAALIDTGFRWGTEAFLPRDPNRPDGPTAWLVTGAVALAILLIVGLSSALAMADRAPDEQTLAAIGAPPGLRRATTAALVLVLTGVGLVLGLAACGVGVAVVGWAMSADGGTSLVVPWAQWVALAVGTPLLGAVVAYLVTPPSRVVAQRTE